MLIGNEKLNVSMIKEALKPTFDNYGVKSATLFGSVAKGENSIDSDVDIMIDTDIRGMKFLGLVETIKSLLNKKVDVITKYQITEGSKVDSEIKKTGLLIYG